MKTLLLIGFLFGSFFSFSQNRAVKDNIACLYGIKNDAGEWVVEPSYQLIRAYSNGYFVASDGVYFGVLDYDGKEIVPCKFDRIQQLGPGMQLVGIGQPVNKPYENPKQPILIRAYLDNDCALYKLNGEQLAQLKKQSFKRDGDHLIISEYHDNAFISRYINMQGEVLLDNVQGVLMPFEKRAFTLVGSTYGRGTATMRIRTYVVDKQGNRILPNAFSEARICRPDVIVYRDSLNRFGAIKVDGTELIQPQYYIEDALLYSGELPCVGYAEHRFIIADDAYRKGIMDGNGKVLCEPAYQEIETGYGWMNTTDVAWRTYNYGRKGLLARNGKVTIPCENDTLIAFAYNSGNRDYNHRKGGFIAKKNSRYGVYDAHGNILIPFEYSFFEMVPNKNDFVLGRAGGLFYVNTASDTLSIDPIETFYESEEVILYETENGTIQALGTDESGVLRPLQAEKIGNVIQVTSFRNRFLFSREGKLLNLGKVYNTRSGGRFIQVRLTDSKQYLIDFNKAEIVHDAEVYKEYNVQLISPNFIWAAKQGEGLQWVILDTNGREVPNLVFDAPFHLSNEIEFAKSKGNWGVYKKGEMEWAISPKYRCMSKVQEGLYKAQRPDMLWDLIRLGDSIIIEGAETLELLASVHDARKQPILFNVTFKEKDALIVDEKGNQVTDPLEIYQLQMKTAYSDPLHCYTEGFQFSGDYNDWLLGQTPVYSSTVKGMRPEYLELPLASLLYDSLLALYNRDNSASAGLVLTTNQTNCNCPSPKRSEFKYDLNYFGPHAASVSISRYYRGYEWDLGHFDLETLMNVVYENGEMRPIRLIEVYAGNNQLLFEDFVATLNENEHLELECSTVENMLERINNRFLFTQDGLQLFPEQNNGRDVRITIPWARIQEHEETKAFVTKFLETKVEPFEIRDLEKDD